MIALFKILRSRLFARRRQDEIEREIDEELHFHIEMRVQDLIAAGMTPESARATAVRRFGEVERIREMCFAVRRKSLNWEAIEPLAWMLAGFALTFWTMSREYHNLPSVVMQLAAIAMMTRSLFIAHRLSRTKAFAYALAGSGKGEKPFHLLEPDEPPNISAYDAQGRTPIKRLLDDE